MATLTATKLNPTPPTAEDEPRTPTGPARLRVVGELHQTSRFGEIEIDPASVISFPEGLIGLGGSRYALICTDPDSPFLWLQSLDNPTVALPVTNPHRFFDEFAVELADDDAARVGLAEGEQADVLVTVTASSERARFTANLKAPILLWGGRGHQLINQLAGAQVKAPLFRSAA